VNGDGKGAEGGEEKRNGRKEKSVGEKKKWKERRRNKLQHDVIFFGAFFCLYVRCQFVSGWQKSPSFCHDQT
jgi:hypothetical protein